jgi:aryl-alcohol dehydrogenase-like predicted oxidoreductase
VPIPGTKRRKYLEENVAAADIALTPAEIDYLKQTFRPGVAAGLRYPAFQLEKMGI